jgi:hypothetical protein
MEDEKQNIQNIQNIQSNDENDNKDEINIQMRNKLNDLINTYHDNNNVYSKLQNFILNQLPETLCNLNNAHIAREERKDMLNKESMIYISNYLEKNKYYYNTSTELFFVYNNEKFSLCKEDDILHNILTSISSYNNKMLIDWKYKIKSSIMKKIRENDVLTAIPESSTIQNVIERLYPTIVASKERAKYFLTIIGDLILKKSTSVYFVTPKLKSFLNELSQLACRLFNTNSFSNVFKYKFYDHKLSDCRIVDVSEYVWSNPAKSFTLTDAWINYFQHEHAIDLFCVAAHYSSRFGSADNFIMTHSNDIDLNNYTFFLKNNTEDNIINLFIKRFIDIPEKSEEYNLNDHKISSKNMMYLWKQYIETERLPNVIFTNNLKGKFREVMNYDESEDVFVGVTSKLLPNVSRFLLFWKDLIDVDLPEMNEEELEIDELCLLFYSSTKIHFTDKTMISLIKHYWTNVVIEDNKYLVNCRSKMWDKKKDISQILKQYQDRKQTKGEADEGEEFMIDSVPISELYAFYSKHHKCKYVASKRYFERYLHNEYSLYITNTNFIKVQSFEVM